MADKDRTRRRNRSSGEKTGDAENLRTIDGEFATALEPEGDGLPVGALVKLALAAGLVAAVVIFVLQNLDTVPVNFLSWSFDAPLILLLAVAAVAGVVLRWVAGFARARRKRTA